ncbi:MFS transporter [Paenibacillus sp. UASWS1643]|uniref:MFS transporter n=1 Tax=Paenibacillus sp. UASWS1643 TaxID=2580422 RepID=UPI0016870C09|nr:glycoside-pentoside-hexuronide (GPH):cation symporter [Paenibacillus sp. UASWS1643]
MARERTNRSLVGDAMGQFGLNISTGLVGIMMYYYTDVVGVSAAVVGTILMLTKILDAFADVGMGVLVDRTNSKHGQAKPWLLWMTLPMLASIILLFSVPDLSSGAKIAYAVVTNLLFFVCVYTPTSIPYNSLMALTTRSQQDRSLMGLYRAALGYLAGMAVAVGFIPVVNAMGGGRLQWTLLASIYGLIAALGIYIAFRSTKEKYNTTQLKELGELKKSYSFMTALRLLSTNKYWIIIVTVGLLGNVLFALSTTSGMYYAKYVWGDVNLVGVMGAIGFIPVVVIFLCSGPVIKRIGKRNTAIVGLIIGTGGALLRLLDVESVPLGLVGSILQSFGIVPLMIVLMPLLTDTIEYGEWKYGQRIVGLTNSINSFAQKIGTALGTAFIGWMLAWGNYKEGADEQGQSAIQMIIGFEIYIPIIVYILIVILLFNFSLDKQYVQILNDLEKRRDPKA